MDVSTSPHVLRNQGEIFLSTHTKTCRISNFSLDSQVFAHSSAFDNFSCQQEKQGKKERKKDEEKLTIQTNSYTVLIKPPNHTSKIE